jgi:hypothetical protein
MEMGMGMGMNPPVSLVYLGLLGAERAGGIKEGKGKRKRERKKQRQRQAFNSVGYFGW